MSLNKLLLGIGIFILLSISALAIPQTINVHGRLTGADNLSISGINNMTFKIYTDFSGGSELYTHGPVSVTTDSRGIYSVILSNINIDFSEQYYLGITVNSDSEMSPRINITSSPYAFRSNTTDFLEPDRNYSMSGLLVDIDTLFVDSSTDKVGIGTILPSQKLDVNGSINISGTSAKLYVPEICLNGDCQTSWPSSTGDGTAGWSNDSVTASTSLNVNIGSGDLFVNSTSGNVGIGTVNPSYKIDIQSLGLDTYNSSNMLNNGALLSIFNTNNTITNIPALIRFGATGAGTQGLAAIGSVTTGSGESALVFGTRDGGNVIERMRIIDSGLIGIGTPSPTSKLTLNGTLRLLDRGNSSSPSIIFGTDDSSGFYSPAAGELGWSYAGVEKFRIDSNGEFGIGVSNPSSLLDISTNVSGSVSNVLELRNLDITSVGSGTSLSLHPTTDVWGAKIFVDRGNKTGYIGSLGFGVSESSDPLNNVRMVIRSDSGNVGIGTINPSQKLDVNGSVNISNSGNLYVTGLAIITGDVVASTFNGSGAGLTGTASSLTAGDLSCTNCIGPTEISDLTLGTDTAGNYVGDVSAGNGITVSGTPGEGYTETISLSAATCSASEYSYWNGTNLLCRSDQNSGGTVTSTGTEGYVAYMSTSTVVANSAMYQTGGKIGLGTTSPQAKLEVNGSIRISGDGGSTCDVNHRGEFRFQNDFSGTEDAVWSCMKNSTGSFNWVLVARGG